MGTPWDKRSSAEQSKLRDAALRSQLADAVGPFSPYWRETVRSLGIRVAEITGAAALVKVPAVGERDLCPDGDPTGTSKLVLQANESGYAVHAPGYQLRRSLLRRVTYPAGYRRMVDNAIRPVSYHLGGLAFPFPIASTRNDLDIVARVGARLWTVLGLTSRDVLVSALPDDGGLLPSALALAALGAGAPAVHAGPSRAPDALAMLPATVVAVADAAGLASLGALPATVRTVLVCGDDSDVAALAGDATVLRVWGPPDGRWLYAECRQGGRATGLHTYPDLEVVETIDPANAEPAAAGELVVTQLGVHGSALVRWRTGATYGGLLTGSCPGCGRTVPRLAPDLRPGVLVTTAEVGGRQVLLDLRAVAGALAGRDDLAGWDVVRIPSQRGAAPLVIARIATADGAASRAADAAVGAYGDIEAAAGSGPTQVVIDASLAGSNGPRLRLD